MNYINLEKTISKELFNSTQNIWEVLPKIKDFIIELGESLDKEKY